MTRMTDEERAAATTTAVTDALTALRAGEVATVNGLLSHAVHAGCTPAELLVEIVAQTGGVL